MKNLGRSYAKLMKNLRHYRYLTKMQKFLASGVIRETLCQRLLLVKYFELKITDNQCDDFLSMLSKNDLSFSYENLRKSYPVDLKKTYENLTTNLGKILRSFENRAPDIWHRGTLAMT